MTFLLSKIYWYVSAPGNFLLLVLLLGVAALRFRRRLGTSLVVIAALGFLAVVVTPIAVWTAYPLEQRFPKLQAPTHVDGIIVLGGAVDTGITKAHGRPSVNEAAERVIEAVVLARRYPDAVILLSGGEGLRAVGRSEAEVTKTLLMDLGVSPGRILLETHSRNTIENAQESVELVHPQPRQVWLLVTSAMHMPRAVGCFRHVGWQVTPDPVDYRLAEGVIARDYFLTDRLGLLELASKEWIGLAAYRLMGRIDDLFPAPQEATSDR